MGKKTVRGHDIANRFVYSLSTHMGVLYFYMRKIGKLQWNLLEISGR